MNMVWDLYNPARGPTHWHLPYGERARAPTQATDFWVLEPTRCQRSILRTHTHQTGELMAKRRAATFDAKLH